MDDFDKMFIKEWCDTDLDNLFKLCDNNSCSSSAAVLAVGTFDTFISDIPTLLPCFLRGVLLLSRLLSTSMATILSEAEDDELVLLVAIDAGDCTRLPMRGISLNEGNLRVKIRDGRLFSSSMVITPVVVDLSNFGFSVTGIGVEDCEWAISLRNNPDNKDLGLLSIGVEFEFLLLLSIDDIVSLDNTEDGGSILVKFKD